MAKLPSPPVLTAAGEYDLPVGDYPGRDFQLILTGSFNGVGVTLQWYDFAKGTWRDVTDGSWSEGVETEFRNPSLCRLKVSAGESAPDIGVTCTLVQRP